MSTKSNQMTLIEQRDYYLQWHADILAMMADGDPITEAMLEMLDYTDRMAGKFALELLGCDVIEIECLFSKSE